MAGAVEVRGIVKAYGGAVAVDGLTFDIEAGTVFALLGPNGAGKTTTVECIEGFRTPDAGEVRVLGMDPRRDRDRVVAAMGVMLQEGGAYPSATPQELLALHAAFYRDPWPPADLLRQLGLTRLARQRYRTLSGGEKQRVNLALALVGRPELLVLDEPTAGMDPQARQAAWDILRELRDRGATVLLTTHFMDEAERLADRVAVIDQGRLLALGSPAALLAETSRLVVTTTARIEPADLAAAVGAQVTREGAGRYVVHDASPRAMAAVAAWFADRDLPLVSVAAGGGLEDVYLRLIRSGIEEPER